MKQASSSKQREREFLRTRNDPTARPARDGAPSDRPRADKATRRRYLREYRAWLWPYRWRLLTIFLLALITTALDMIWPLGIKWIMDGVLVDNSGTGHARFHQLVRISGIILAVLICKQPLDTPRSWRTASLDARVTIRL